MDKKNFAFDRVNYILLAVGMMVVIIGFVLMSGGSSDEKTFNPDIFDSMHITVAPLITFIGFVSIVYAILRKPKNSEE
ncbi:MAG: DUF3098 domain-containing protein [Prevotella sp.]|nr:DUF3098 domain-containing protein [Prevotella sp.]